MGLWNKSLESRPNIILQSFHIDPLGLLCEMDILRTDFTDLLSLHTCPEIFILFFEWNVTGWTVEITTVVSVIVEELCFEWYWFTAI